MEKVVILHGWSDSSESMRDALDAMLRAEGFEPAYVDYDSLDDEARYDDFAEELDALLTPNVISGADPRSVHFITHSTGALVLREWLTSRASAQTLLTIGNVVMLAPPNFGSPLAHKGRSLLGRLFKAQRERGDDFGEVGLEVLRGLELASPLQWELANRDLFSGGMYGPDDVRVSIITGSRGYGGIRRFANEDGTDGTIVVAGANLNSRRLRVDATGTADRVDWSISSSSADPPFAIHGGLHHGSVLKDADNDRDLHSHILDALKVSSPAEYRDLHRAFSQFTSQQVSADDAYQQFLFRLRDERGTPIEDYHIGFEALERSRNIEFGEALDLDQVLSREEHERSAELDEMLRENGHTHSQARHLKRFLIKPRAVDEVLGEGFVLALTITATSDDDDIWYDTTLVDGVVVYDPLKDQAPKLFWPNTTTLLDVTVRRASELVSLDRQTLGRKTSRRWRD